MTTSSYFMSLPEELVHYANEADKRLMLLNIRSAAESIFSKDTRLHCFLNKRALDEDMIFFVKQFFALYTPHNLLLTRKQKWQNLIRRPIEVFECEKGILVLSYIRTKVTRIIAVAPLQSDPRINPISVYRGALKLNQILRQRIIL